MTHAALAGAVEAALASGAARAEAFHRKSLTRLVVLEPDGRAVEGTRIEEGVAVRAWSLARAGRDHADSPGRFGFACGTAGEAPAALGRQAAAVLLSAGQRRRKRRVAEDDVQQPLQSSPPAPRPSGDEGLFDPEVVRLTLSEGRARLRALAEVASVARRTGLSAGVRAELRLAVVETTLLRPDGVLLAFRGTLAAMQIRFPTAFGLGRIEIVSRRLADLDPSVIVAMLASYPARAGAPGRARVRIDGEGGHDLWISAPLLAAVTAVVAERAAREARPVILGGQAIIADDPSLPWAPGSAPFDGEGQALVRRVLAGPEERMRETPAVSFSPMRRSFREPARRAPTNLVLEGMPPGGRVRQPASLHLLEPLFLRDDRLIGRGSLRRDGEEDRPMLALLEGPPELILGPRTRAASGRAHFATGSFVSAPAVVVPNVQVIEEG